MPRISSSIDPDAQDPTRLLLSIGATVAALYFGSEIFVPIALAILLSFVLAPAVRLLHAWHLGRVVPVILVSVLAFAAILGSVDNLMNRGMSGRGIPLAGVAL